MMRRMNSAINLSSGMDVRDCVRSSPVDDVNTAGYIADYGIPIEQREFPFQCRCHSLRTLEAVLTGIPAGSNAPITGGVTEELREIFRQLDQVLAQAGTTKTAVCSVRLYLADVLRDIAAVNSVYRDYFGTHPPNRRAYGVTLQSGMLIEAAFVAEIR